MKARIAPSILTADFAKAGANIITYHPEASEHIDRTIGLIHDCGCKAGLAFNPATPLSWLEVDGGGKADNIGTIARAGADTFVAGPAISGSGDYANTIADLRAAIAEPAKEVHAEAR